MDIATRGHAVILSAVVAGNPVDIGGSAYGLLPYAAPMPGVPIILAAHRNGPGIGYLKSHSEGPVTLAWKAPGATEYGSPQTILAGGLVWALPGAAADKWAVAVTESDPTKIQAGQEFPVYLEDRYNTGLGDSDIAAPDALAGITVDTELQFQNIYYLPVYNLAVWIDATFAFGSIRLGGAGPFVSPTTEATAIGVPILAAGATLRLDIRRTIPPATASNPRAISWIHYRFDL